MVAQLRAAGGKERKDSGLRFRCLAEEVSQPLCGRSPTPCLEGVRLVDFAPSPKSIQLEMLQVNNTNVLLSV